MQFHLLPFYNVCIITKVMHNLAKRLSDLVACVKVKVKDVCLQSGLNVIECIITGLAITFPPHKLIQVAHYQK